MIAWDSRIGHVREKGRRTVWGLHEKHSTQFRGNNIIAAILIVGRVSMKKGRRKDKRKVVGRSTHEILLIKGEKQWLSPGRQSVDL